MPNLSMAARVSPPPAMEKAGEAAMARRSPGAFSELVELEHADRAVPQDGLGVHDDVGQGLGGIGPMSKIMSPSVTSDTDLMVAGWIRENSATHNHVGGHRNVGFGSQFLGGVDQVVLAQGLADVVTGSSDEGVGDATTDHQLVSDLERDSSTVSLGDLEPPTMANHGGSGLEHGFAQGFQLTGQQGPAQATGANWATL